MAMAGRSRSRSRIAGRATWTQMTCLTISSVGVQFVWSAEMSQVSPYLLSLGLSKTQMAIVLLAGPLSGLVVQPLIGIYGDRSRHPLGRRRPFILYGGLCTTISLLTFAWSQDLASVLPVSLHKGAAIFLAIIAFFVVDFSVNVVMAAGKSLIVDCLPSSKQPLANAYSSTLAGVASVISQIISYTDLPSLINPAISQLKLVIAFSVLVFSVSQSVTCLTVHEARIPAGDLSSPYPTDQKKSVTETWTSLWRTWKSLDGTLVKSIFWIQFWSWLGWFPLLFYSSTWIGEIWKGPGVWTPDQHEEATRIGSVGLLIESVLSLTSSVVIPQWISKLRSKDTKGSPHDSDGRRHLVKLWLASQVIFSLLLGFSPFFGRNHRLAIVMVGLSGPCWSVTIWVPSTLLGELITQAPSLSQGDVYRLLPRRKSHLNSSAPPLEPVGAESTSRQSIESFDEEEQEEPSPVKPIQMSDNQHLQDAGAILGIHNTFVVIPQFLISLISAVVLGRTDGQEADGISTVFRIGSLASLVAAVFCWRMLKKITA